MFNKFLTALLQKILLFLKANPDFFSKTENSRIKNLETLSVPNSFKSYLTKTEENEFIKDLSLILKFMKTPDEKGIKTNRFFISFMEFLTTELATKTDLLNGDYYLLDSDERSKIIDKLIKSDSLLAKSLKEILINHTYQQLAGSINRLASKVIGSKYLVIQSPREISHELKRDIREKLALENPLSFPIFQINKKLIGGIRIFENSASHDHSWFSRVLKFTSLT